MNASTLVQKLWNYCNVLRDDGMSYGDYVEQLTCLLFLKMADERSNVGQAYFAGTRLGTKPPYNQSLRRKSSMTSKQPRWSNSG